MADDGEGTILKVGMDTSGHTAGKKEIVKNMDEIKSKTEETAKSFKSSWSSAVADVASQNNARLKKMLPDDAATVVGTNAAKSMTKGLTDQFRADQALVKSHLQQGLLDADGAREAAVLNARTYSAELAKLVAQMDVSGVSRTPQGKAGSTYLTDTLRKESSTLDIEGQKEAARLNMKAYNAEFERLQEQPQAAGGGGAPPPKPPDDDDDHAAFKASWAEAIADVASRNGARLKKMLPEEAATVSGTLAAKSMTRGLTDQFKEDQALVKSHLQQGLLDEEGAAEAAQLNAKAYNAELTKVLVEFEESGMGKTRQGRSATTYVAGLLQEEGGPKHVDHYASRSVGLMQDQATKLNEQFDAAKNHTPTMWEKLFPNSSHVAKARKDMGMLDALHDEAVKHEGAHHMSVGRLEMMFEHFISHASGLNPMLGRVVATMGHFAVGTIPMIAGLAALAAGFALWEAAMRPVHEQHKLLEEDMKKLEELAKKVDERRQGPTFVLARPEDEIVEKEKKYKEHKESTIFEGANRWFARHQGNTTALEDEEKEIADLRSTRDKGQSEIARDQEAVKVRQLAQLASSRFATKEAHNEMLALEGGYNRRLKELLDARAVILTKPESRDRDNELALNLEGVSRIQGFLTTVSNAAVADPFESIRDSAKDLIHTLEDQGAVGSFTKQIDKFKEAAKKSHFDTQNAAEYNQDLKDLYVTLEKVRVDQLRPLGEDLTASMNKAKAALKGKQAEEMAGIQSEIDKWKTAHKGMHEPQYVQAAKDIKGKHFAEDQTKVNEDVYAGSEGAKEDALRLSATLAGTAALHEYNTELAVRKMYESAGAGASETSLKVRAAQIRAAGANQDTDKLAGELAQGKLSLEQAKQKLTATKAGADALHDYNVELQVQQMLESSGIADPKLKTDRAQQIRDLAMLADQTRIEEELERRRIAQVQKMNQPMENAFKSMESSFEDTTDKMFANGLHSYRDFVKQAGGILSTLAGSKISLRIAEIVLGTRHEVLDANGKPTGNFENAGGLFGKGGLFKSESYYNEKTDSDEMHGGRFEKYAGAAKGAAGALAGGAAGYAYGLTTTNKEQAAMGGAMSGAMAGTAFGPAGAIIGGVVGMVGGLMGSAHAAKQAAREMEEARKSFDSSMKAYVAVATRTNSALGDALRQNQDQERQLLLQANQAYSGKKNEKERNAIRKEIEATAGENAKRLVEDWHKSLDEQMRTLQGDTYSNQLEEINKQYLENVNAAKAAGNAVADLAKVERIRTLELQKAQRAHDLEINTTKEDYRVRTLMSQGRTYEADRLRQVIAQEKELAEATEKWGATNPELIAQLKKVQELERLHGATELANAIRNGPTGFRVMGYQYEFANVDRPVGTSSADSGSTSTGNSGLGAPSGATYEPPVPQYADDAVTRAKEDGYKTSIGQQLNVTLTPGSVVIENAGAKSPVELAYELVDGLRQIGQQTSGINTSPSDTMDRM